LTQQFVVLKPFGKYVPDISNLSLV